MWLKYGLKYTEKTGEINLISSIQGSALGWDGKYITFFRLCVQQ
jgi:hypothetical protein